MFIVSNTSPLIFLTKVPRLIELLRKFYKKLIIPNEVYIEAVEEGLKSENPSIKENALRIKKLVEENFIEVRSLKRKWIKLRNSLQLATGEASAIALALQEKIENVLIDEKRASTIAKTFKLVSRPISLLPIEAFRKDYISKQEALNLLDDLLINNYHLSSDAYKQIISMLEK